MFASYRNRPYQSLDYSEAVCTTTDPEIFFADANEGRNRSYDIAREVCAKCPLMAPCLIRAVEDGEEFGMWGGAKPKERRGMKLHPERIAEHIKLMTSLKIRLTTNDELAQQILPLYESL